MNIPSRFGGCACLGVTILLGWAVAALSGPVSNLDGPVVLDFGRVSLGQSTSKPLVLTNNSVATVSLISVSLTNSSFALSATNLPIAIAPAGLLPLEVRFSPRLPGTNSGVLTLVWSNSAASNLPIPLVGVGFISPGGLPAISVTPAALDFGKVAVGKVEEKAFTVSNTGDGSLSFSSLDVDNSQFTITLGNSSAVLLPGERQTILVRFAPRTADQVSSLLHVRSSDPRNPDVAVALLGTGVLRQIEVSPSPLDFGKAPVGQSVGREFAIKNTGSLRFTVT